MPVLSSLETKAAAFLGLRLLDDARGTDLSKRLIAEGLLRYDGASWSIDDTNRKLLPLAPELLDKAKLRQLHNSGDRGAWSTLCDAIHGEMKEASRRNERHLIPELNHASPLRLERNPIAKPSAVPGVRDENYWKNLEKEIEGAIVGGKQL